MSSWESRSTTFSSSLGPSVRLGELVVEVVVVRLERLHLRRALLAAPAVDVEVRQDPQEPRAEVRARRVRAPAAERPRVRLLDEVVRLLARAREMPRDAVDLVGEAERLLLEADAVARLDGEALASGPSAPRMRHRQLAIVPRAVDPRCARPADRPEPSVRRERSGASSLGELVRIRAKLDVSPVKRAKPRGSRPSPSARAGVARRPLVVPLERDDWPIRFAFAPSRPSWPVSTPASRCTHCSQRMPLTWNVSVCVATAVP